MSKQPGLNKKTLSVNGINYAYHDITSLDRLGMSLAAELPYSVKILLESALRNYDGRRVTLAHIRRIACRPGEGEKEEIPFIPARIVLQDFTGVPVIVELAAMRAKMAEMGEDAGTINPVIPVDFVIDHSVTVDSFGTPASLAENVEKEFSRNAERYTLLKWAQNSFANVRVFPPSVGIIHQINLEFLATVATTRLIYGEQVIFPDTLLGTDSHTTMINGIGVLGWGAGGIEAEAAMLGQPLYFLMPDVVGFKLTGRLSARVTATDLVLTMTHILRKAGVVNKFIEFYGEGVSQIQVEDRATVANMCPEYGATAAYFPVDGKTLAYLRATGRPESQIALIESYYRAQGMFRTDEVPVPAFTSHLHLDLATVEPSVAGPKRPQDRIGLQDMKNAVRKVLLAPFDAGGYRLAESKVDEVVEIKYLNGEIEYLKAGSVVIAAITSCTNTSNPAAIMGAGLLAKKAVERGLTKPRHVKSSLAPGSLVVTEYLSRSGLLPYLEKLGFHTVGYGCTTCIGNSGPLVPKVSAAVRENDMTVAAVLSGNRNFEGRIHAQVKMNYLASPLLVVAYALSGHMGIDFDSEPISHDGQGTPVYLRDIWPEPAEIEQMIQTFVKPEIYRDTYRRIFQANEWWNRMPVTCEMIYPWAETSTYIKMPPFFNGMKRQPEQPENISGAAILAVLGDSITTDHISPAGSIPDTSDAGIYLTALGVRPGEFNSYGSRRGNHEVMVRGTFANTRIRNQMIPGVEGGYTRHVPSREIMTIFNAAMAYAKRGTPLVIIAGKEYGTGSSRDWAAKGTLLLGVQAVMAESYERIHRNNLIGMGIMPLQFLPGENAGSLGLTGNESLDITGMADGLYPDKRLAVTADRCDGTALHFEVLARLDSQIEVEYFLNQGILNLVLRNFLN